MEIDSRSKALLIAESSTTYFYHYLCRGPNSAIHLICLSFSLARSGSTTLALMMAPMMARSTVAPESWEQRRFQVQRSLTGSASSMGPDLGAREFDLVAVEHKEIDFLLADDLSVIVFIGDDDLAVDEGQMVTNKRPSTLRAGRWRPSSPAYPCRADGRPAAGARGSRHKRPLQGFGSKSPGCGGKAQLGKEKTCPDCAGQVIWILFGFKAQ